jgi:hypothetical protein
MGRLRKAAQHLSTGCEENVARLIQLSTAKQKLIPLVGDILEK